MGELAAHPVVRRWYPALVEAALTVGSVAIRNRASLVGNACNGSPAADTAPALLVHGASITIASRAGERTVPLDDFFLGPRRTLCGPDELVTRIDLPRPPEGSGSAFRRLTRRRGVDLATVSVAAARRRRRPRRARPRRRRPAAAAHRARRPVRPRRTCPRSCGRWTSGSTIATPISDIRGSREYRHAMLRVLARRAILAAADRRTPGRWRLT